MKRVRSCPKCSLANAYLTTFSTPKPQKEAEIIAQAGRKGAVTIATNMAGRGTDIRLGGNPDYMARAKMESDGYKPEIIEAATSFAKIEDPEVLLAKAEYERHYGAFKK